MMNHNSAIAEWRRAQASLRAASVCFRDRCYADAVSRAYYAVLHAARAGLLHSNNDSGSSHPATNQLFGLHLIRNGVVERVWGREIGRLYDLRMKADYDIAEVFSAGLAREVCQSAERFLERIMRFLTQTIPFAELSRPFA